ncbi:hypothetical protein [Burkholderia ubonensis]|uniref:hypothetical protein n=1 Tax=Burkholderia ubonensis TaxID=101571 RepID=UPI0007597AE3|nr:hypothetical protein [Burkholderia ubonensis]KVP17187.1 hypothetical protein WJ84_02595 [Burkholderia ubonensis]KVP39688.1 hypothetical protein WJ87_05755 [Burkholderia ubonensis]
MNSQKGSAGLIALGVLVAAVVVLGGSYVSAYNTGNQLEKKLDAEYSNNENLLGQYSQKVLEATQVPDMMRDDIMKVTKEAIQGRYGPDGARATFQMITEQNPQVSPQVYVKLQQIIEAGRDEFKNGQTRMIDSKRAYETALGSFWQGTWMRIAGYPKVDLSKYKVITTDSVHETFRTGKESGPIQLRPKN